MLVVLIDDAGFGSSSAFGGPCQRSNYGLYFPPCPPDRRTNRADRRTELTSFVIARSEATEAISPPSYLTPVPAFCPPPLSAAFCPPAAALSARPPVRPSLNPPCIPAQIPAPGSVEGGWDPAPFQVVGKDVWLTAREPPFHDAGVDRQSNTQWPVAGTAAVW